jgi:ATP-binding cassette subfamily F protein uup
MALISLQNIHLSYGSFPLLDNITLQIERNHRVSLLGKNGAGKSSLLAVMNNDLLPDSGTVSKEQHTIISLAPQTIPDMVEGTAHAIIETGLRAASRHVHQNGWTPLHQVRTLCTRMQIDPDAVYTSMSGGQKRRVLLARALVSEPDVLLLDEPTNHLDLDSILWLEDFILRSCPTIVFVTHDRMLLRKIATRIIELDRGRLVDWSCDYDTFLERKAAVLDAEEKDWGRFDKKLAGEEVWIRKGIRARRTRDEGRVKAMEEMRKERAQRRERTGNINLNFCEAGASGKLVLEAKNISFSYGDRRIIDSFSTLICRGDKIGIIGPVGSGKTTLVRLLLRDLAPDSGTVVSWTNLSISYFDQLRLQLDPARTVKENVLPNGDTVMYDGKSQHVFSYLQDFLFTRERADSPVGLLSGGEKNRLLLAKLFSQPANVLVMDEPTNDLDVETLELLEELLVNFKGTLLLISHDRVFLNNVVTSILAFSEKPGDVISLAGDFTDWEHYRERKAAADNKTIKDKKPSAPQEKKRARPRKLSFNEKKELASLPALIEKLEQEQRLIHEEMARPDFYTKKDNVIRATKRLEEIEKELSQAFERWAILDAVEKE